MPLKLKLEWLNYFNILVEQGSFQQAAQELFITQQALSNYLARLEQRLNVSLIERQGQNKNQLTPEGERFYRLLQPILSKAQSLQNFSKCLPANTLAETVNLAIQPLWMNLKLAAVLQSLQSQHPHLGWSVQGQTNESTILEGLLKAEVDMAILTPSHYLPELNYLSLYYSPCVIVCSQAQTGKTWQKLNFIRYLRQTPALTQLDQLTFWPEERFPRQIGLETDHLLQAIEWCLQGLGALFLPRAFIEPWLNTGLLFEISSPPTQIELEAALVWNPVCFSPATELQLICELGNALQTIA